MQRLLLALLLLASPVRMAYAQQQVDDEEPGKHKKKKEELNPQLPPWAEHVTDPDWWRTQHAWDVKHSRSGDFQYGANPEEKGFMTLREELVRALVLAGLTWGGVYNRDKDLMHFDLRTGSIAGRPVA